MKDTRNDATRRALGGRIAYDFLQALPRRLELYIEGLRPVRTARPSRMVPARRPARLLPLLLLVAAAFLLATPFTVQGQAADATLSDLTVSGIVALDPAFSSSETSYRVAVKYGVDVVTVTATPSD